MYSRSLYSYVCIAALLEHSLDATVDDASHGLARFINHSRANPNLHPVRLDNAICESGSAYSAIVLISMRDISAGEELLFDYGDRNSGLGWLDE